MRRLTSLILGTAASSIIACNEYPVEHCVDGQGVVLEDDGVPFAGAEGAPVEMTVFSDFQCPGTWQLWYEVSLLLSRLEDEGRLDDLTVRFRHFPLEAIHDRSRAAAIAAEAAHRQGDDAFWSIFFSLMKGGAELTEEHLLYYAEVAGLDMEAFAADRLSEEVGAIVDRDTALAGELDLPGTPGVILCGVPISGYPDEVIDNLEHLLR